MSDACGLGRFSGLDNLACELFEESTTDSRDADQVSL
jgi:hypothetical protein